LPESTWQRCRTHYLSDLLAKVAKSQQPWVATLVRTIFDQPDATEVEAQFQRVTEALPGQLPEAAEHLEQARCELLALPHFRKGALAPDLEFQPSNAIGSRADHAEVNTPLLRT
jgi:putative transposase